jgi:hypothetical protein
MTEAIRETERGERGATGRVGQVLARIKTKQRPNAGSGHP